MKRKTICIAILMLLLLCGCNKENKNTLKGDNTMTEEFQKVKLKINNQNFTATLVNNETTKELIKSLPLEMNMSDLNNNEKYYYFSNKLPSAAENIGNIQAGDIMLYQDNCIVIFYESFKTSYTYTRIGKIEEPSGLKEALKGENVIVTISI